LDASESNVRDTIARMIREGSLRYGQCCAVTMMPTNDIMLFDVQCEKSYVKGRASKKWGIALLILGFFACFPVAIFMWLVGFDLFKTDVERVGHDVVISIPLRVIKDSQRSVRNWGQSRLKNTLASVPVYQRLFDEYPDAAVFPRNSP
jgi:hypothetical protein